MQILAGPQADSLRIGLYSPDCVSSGGRQGASLGHSQQPGQRRGYCKPLA